MNRFDFIQDVTFDSHNEWSVGPVLELKGSLDPKSPGDYELRIGGKRVCGVIDPGKDLDIAGLFPSGGIAALRLNGDKSVNDPANASTTIVRGEGLSYRFKAWGKGYSFAVGWRENGKSVKAGDRREAWTLTVANVFEKEFTGPDAGFSPALLDRLESGNWFKALRGKVIWKMLPLGVEADGYAAMVNVPEVVFPINSLPIAVSGLHPHRTAYYAEPGANPRRRPVAVDAAGTARVQFDRRKKGVTIWVGHPVVCDKPEVWFDLSDAGDGRWIIDANNTGDSAVDATFSPGTDCPFMKFAPIKASYRPEDAPASRPGQLII